VTTTLTPAKHQTKNAKNERLDKLEFTNLIRKMFFLAEKQQLERVQQYNAASTRPGGYPSMPVAAAAPVAAAVPVAAAAAAPYATARPTSSSSQQSGGYGAGVGFAPPSAPIQGYRKVEVPAEVANAPLAANQRIELV